MANQISGHVGVVVSNVVVIYRGQRTNQVKATLSDSQGNHSVSGLQPDTFIITAQSPGLVFNSVVVVIDPKNPQDALNINLRSRAVNASNAQQGGF